MSDGAPLLAPLPSRAPAGARARVARHLAWMTGLASASLGALGCLGFMVVDPAPEPAQCGVESEPPVRVYALRADDGLVGVEIWGTAVRIDTIAVTGGTATTGALPAASVRVTVRPDTGASAVLLFVTVTCADGVADQRWFQVALGTAGDRLEVTPMTGTAG